MANQQFCLRWNNYQSNLTQVFDQLLQAESFVDVTLSCEGNSVKAHRMVLSACSPYFQCLLSEAPCTHPVVILQGVKWTELKAVVEFMYKGEINISQDQLGGLLRVAESLKIRGLAEVDGDGGENVVLTSPAASPATRAATSAPDDSMSPTLASFARKRRRLSGGGEEASRPTSPSTPTSAPELLDLHVDLTASLANRGGSAPLPGSPATTLQSLAAHLPTPMPPPAPMPPHHLTHLPPLSPLLNMHHIHRHHTPDDFEIRPGIAEMIREEERVRMLGWSPPNPFRTDNTTQQRRRDAPDMAKLLESSHHWMGTSMADGGGPVFPSMFPDPPAGSSASKPAGASSRTVQLASKCEVATQQQQQPSLHAPAPPLSQPPPPPYPPMLVPPLMSKMLVTQEVNSSVARSLPPKISIKSVAACNSGVAPVSVASTNTVSISAIRKSSSSHILPKMSTTTTAAGTGNITSPSPSMPLYRVHGGPVGLGPPHGLGNFVGGGALEAPWESLHGAVSAPKSGASRWTQSDLVAALALVKAGTPIKPAAERCNIPVMTLWRRTRALGIVSSKVQCGFRYPAARKRSKTEPDHSTAVKCEAGLLFPIKAEPSKNNTAGCLDPPPARPKSDVAGNPSKDPVVIHRAGPLREMSALHALCRVASRENSPRPLGRENSPKPLGPHSRENSPNPTSRGNLQKHSRENSPRLTGRENSPRPLGRENSPKLLSRENTPRPLGRENSPRRFGKENSPRPLGKGSQPRAASREGSPKPFRRESSPRALDSIRPSVMEKRLMQMNIENRSHTLADENGPQMNAREESPALVVERNATLPLERRGNGDDDLGRQALKYVDMNHEESEREGGSPRSNPRASLTPGRTDRFRAWVDIVLEGAGTPPQQEDLPQDLSTRHQRHADSTTQDNPQTSSASTTTTTTTPNPATSQVQE